MRFLFIFLFSASGLLIAQTAQPTMPVGSQSVSANIAPLPPSGVVPMEVIARDFALNSSAAKGKYGDRRIKVLGFVSKVENGQGDIQMIVTLVDPDYPTTSVNAEFILGSLPFSSDLQIISEGGSAALLIREKHGKKRQEIGLS